MPQCVLAKIVTSSTNVTMLQINMNAQPRTPVAGPRQAVHSAIRYKLLKPAIVALVASGMEILTAVMVCMFHHLILYFEIRFILLAIQNGFLILLSAGCKENDCIKCNIQGTCEQCANGHGLNEAGNCTECSQLTETECVSGTNANSCHSDGTDCLGNGLCALVDFLPAPLTFQHYRKWLVTFHVTVSNIHRALSA